MTSRKIKNNIHWLGAIDWDRRFLNSLIPLPDGTSYNAYLVQGSEKTALLDTVDPMKSDALMTQLNDCNQVDYVVCRHRRQDHSGAEGGARRNLQRRKF